MEKNYIKAVIDEINIHLGINVNDIIDNPGFDQNQKMNQIYKEVLTASIKLLQKNDITRAFNLPEDFNIDEFVNSQMTMVEASGSQDKTNKYLQCIPNILLLQDVADEIKKLEGHEIEAKVKELFELSTAVLKGNISTEEIVDLFIEFGIIAIGSVGAAAALVALGAATGVGLVLGVIAGIVASITVILSFCSFIWTIFTTGVLFDRSFFGVVLNDTEHDLLIPGWKEAHNRSAHNSGIYRKHGWLSAIMVDNYNGGEAALVKAKEQVNDQTFCYCGLYLFEKETSLYGVEGTIRFETNKSKFDLFSACPLTFDNRIFVSNNYVNSNLGKSNDSMDKEWNNTKPIRTEILVDGMNVVCSLNKKRESPVYGITYIDNKKV